jgi:hypothetical protein
MLAVASAGAGVMERAERFSPFPLKRNMRGGETMKRSLIAVVVLAMGLFTVSCASQGYNTQKGAAIGGAAGALMGQAIGHNTAGTLIGAASGMLLGAVIGNARDQDEWNARTAASDARPRDYARPSPAPEGPPGEWVTVPGQWSGGKWVPSHRVWVPVNP